MLIGGLTGDQQLMTDCFYFRPPHSSSSYNGQEDFLCRPEKLESPNIQQTAYSVAKVNNLAVLTGGLAQAATDEVKIERKPFRTKFIKLMNFLLPGAHFAIYYAVRDFYETYTIKVSMYIY